MSSFITLYHKGMEYWYYENDVYNDCVSAVGSDEQRHTITFSEDGKVLDIEVEDFVN